VSGQVGLDGEGALAATDVASQARQAFDNETAILAACGGDVVRKVTVYIVDPQSQYGDHHEVAGHVLRALLVTHRRRGGPDRLR
jgi:enamine deaminase RidA (YjgF/YER057c/UK114 family)